MPEEIKYRIDPSAWTEPEWAECCNATDGFLPHENIRDQIAEGPFERSREEITNAIASCGAKRKALRVGLYGHAGTAQWRAELRGAINHLRDALGSDVPRSRVAVTEHGAGTRHKNRFGKKQIVIHLEDFPNFEQVRGWRADAPDFILTKKSGADVIGFFVYMHLLNTGRSAVSVKVIWKKKQ